MTIEELENWLVSNGFRTAINPLRNAHNECAWYAYRRSKLAARECETNDGKGCQIVVTPSRFSIHGITHEDIEVDICGEANGVWWSLRAYSLSFDELVKRLEDIETSLVAAWNALKVTEDLTQTTYQVGDKP